MYNKFDFETLLQIGKLALSLIVTSCGLYIAHIFDSAKFFATAIAALLSAYFVLQRFHLRLQVRFLKNISDEIIKINDFCIEFSYKHEQLLETIFPVNDDTGKGIVSDSESEEEKTEDKVDLDLKLIAELKTLRSKVKNHLDYLTSQINAFPYGNPLNFFWFSLSGKYLVNNIPLAADSLLTTYQDVILTDTILQSEISLCDDYKQDGSDVKLIDSDKIDEIVVSGIDLITLLEDHSKKFI